MTFKTILLLILLYLAFRAVRNLLNAIQRGQSAPRVDARRTYHYHQPPPPPAEPFRAQQARPEGPASEAGTWHRPGAPTSTGSRPRPEVPIEDAKWRDITG